ncbi:MAG TPA: hypothetical protein VEQ63_06940 [Bryobacteraceae bacterium]|nr:hypothetical protein [Bryobacteraceae bacterium]
MRAIRTLSVPLLTMGILYAQDAALPAGHWEGAIKSPQQEVPITIDLYQDAKNAWVGHFAITIPNGPREIPVDQITVNGEAVTLQVNLGQSLTFRGKVDAAAKTFIGTAPAPGGQEVPFELKMTGPAKVISPSTSTAIDKSLEGRWEGSVEAGQTLRLALDLSTGLDGKGLGTLTSIDQGGTQLPIGNLSQQGPKLSFDIKRIGGTFSGTLNEAKTEITGTWAQAGRDMPLTWKKAGGADAKPPQAPKPEEKK